jgi:hypothetical protein
MTLLVGPQRMTAGLAQVRTHIQGVVDECVDNPVALRRQLESLSQEYPERIAEVHGELHEVESQIAEIERDIEIAQRVVGMTSDDLGELKTLVDRAEVEGDTRFVKISFEGMRYSVDQAMNEARRIHTVRENYEDRLAYDRQQLVFLGEQRERLDDIKSQLVSEYSQFQTQLLQVDRQIDAIERNERLIELSKRQQATLDSYKKFEKVANFHQIEAQLVELQRYQEAQFQVLKNRGIQRDYEKEAIYEMETTDEMESPFEELETEDTASTTSTSRTFAWNGPIVIEIDD